MATQRKVTIRDYAKADNAIVVPMWKAGFHEMSPSSYKRLFSGIGPLAFFGTLSVASHLLIRPQNQYLSLGFFAFGAMLYTPVGKWLLSGLFWQIIGLQARASMSDIEVRWMKPGKSHFYVAETEGVVVGCVAVKSVHALAAEKSKKAPEMQGEASVWRLTVAPEARKLGVGRLLMQKAESWARENGCTHVSLITGNEESQRFYAKIGYVVETEQRARTVLFGIDGCGSGEENATDYNTGAGIYGRLKLTMLRNRLRKNKTILMKKL